MLFSDNNDVMLLYLIGFGCDTSFDHQCIVLLQGCDNTVDTTALLRSCVQSAVGMLRDQVESGLRSTQRVEILLTLLSDSDEVKGTNSIFFQCIFFSLFLSPSAKY